MTTEFQQRVQALKKSGATYVTVSSVEGYEGMLALYGSRPVDFMLAIAPPHCRIVKTREDVEAFFLEMEHQPPISAVDAIKYALKIGDAAGTLEDAIAFLETWAQGDWTNLRTGWPKAFEANDETKPFPIRER